jgi:enamine deaminase RidA (YjgF/YER057c/UK114 family)
MAIKRIDVGPRMSQCVVHNGVAYLAGVVAKDTAAGVKGQTQQILAEIDRLLKAAGTDKTKILKANIWLSDIANFAEMNAAWDAWAPQGHTPARATVESKLATPAYQVEIMVEAAV